MAPHLDDRALLHLVDRDASAMELDLWSRHLIDCAPCTARLDERRRDSDRVRVAVGAIQLPPGFPGAEETMRRARSARAGRSRPAATPWTEQRWLRAAAVAILLLLPLALVAPLRAALVEWVRGAWTQLAGAPERAPSPAAPSPAPPRAAESGFTVYFTPRGSRLELTIETAQAAGELVLSRAAGPEGSIEVLGADDETPLITDTGLSIRNSTASRASYRVAIPGSVDRVVVRIGNGAPVSLSADAVRAGWTVEL